MTALALTLLMAFPAISTAQTTSVSIQVTRGSTTVTVPGGTVFTDPSGRQSIALACTTTTLPSTVCTRSLSVGGTTITLRDISTSNRARVFRIDSSGSTDVLDIAGLIATSGPGITSTSRVTLKIIATSNQFGTLNYSCCYAYTAAMSGRFSTAAGARASACGSTTPCVTMKLTANGITVNQFGDNVVATVNVPTISSSGTFGPPSNPSETKSAPCGTSGVSLSCRPSLRNEVTAIFAGSSETFTLVSSARAGGSKRPITDGGLIDTFVDVVAPESDGGRLDLFVTYDQDETLRATLAQDGASFRSVDNSSTVPQAWSIQKPGAALTSDEFTLLQSILSNIDSFDDGAHLSFLPTPSLVRVRDIFELSVDYDWTVGDCAGNSWYVGIQLADLRVIKIRLGSSPGFLADCNNEAGDDPFRNVNLTSFGGANVELPDGSVVKYNTMRGRFGSALVRSISLFLTGHQPPDSQDQAVKVFSYTVGTSVGFFQFAGGALPTFVNTCDFPGTNEFMTRYTHVGTGESFIWADGYSIQGCQLRTHVPITEFLQENPSGGFWRAELLFNERPVGTGTMELLSNNPK